MKYCTKKNKSPTGHILPSEHIRFPPGLQILRFKCFSVARYRWYKRNESLVEKIPVPFRLTHTGCFICSVMFCLDQNKEPLEKGLIKREGCRFSTKEREQRSWAKKRKNLTTNHKKPGA